MTGLFTDITTLEYFHPVAVEGETLLSTFAFLPLSLAGLAAAMLAHAALGGVSCSLWPSSCRSANGVPVRPIGLGLAANRYLPPGSRAAAWVGVTGMRTAESGWDTLEHYEVIAAGGLPYLLELERCPQYSLHAMPKHLLARYRHPDRSGDRHPPCSDG